MASEHEEAEVVMGVDLGSTENVIAVATLTKDGEMIDCSIISNDDPWITNLEPFRERGD